MQGSAHIIIAVVGYFQVYLSSLQLLWIGLILFTGYYLSLGEAVSQSAMSRKKSYWNYYITSWSLHVGNYYRSQRFITIFLGESSRIASVYCWGRAREEKTKYGCKLDSGRSCTMTLLRSQYPAPGQYLFYVHPMQS